MIGGDFDTPIMYQDLANYTMSPMNIPFGYMGGMNGMYNTSYLGGVQMQQQPNRDDILLMNKKKQEGKNTFKKAMMLLGGLFLVGFVPRISKGIKKNGFFGYIKNLFSNKPAKGNIFQRSWHKIKNICHKKP